MGKFRAYPTQISNLNLNLQATHPVDGMNRSSLNVSILV